MKNIFLILLTTLGFPLFAAEKQQIIFTRPARVERPMRCRMVAVKNTRNTISFADIKQQDKVNSLLQKITAEGRLKVLGVLKTGHASKVEFTFDKVSGNLNQMKFKPDWQGKTLIADLTVKPVCQFSFKDAKKELAPIEIKMLSMLFSPAPKENMGDYIGTDKKIKIGDSWDAKTEPFVKLFKREGLLFDQKHINGKVVLKSRKKIEGIDCWEIEEKLQVKGLADFAFHFNLSIFLPVKSDLGNVKMNRKAFMKIEKNPQGKHFMISGIKKIVLEVTDTMTAVMVPEGKL